jgi:protein AroM
MRPLLVLTIGQTPRPDIAAELASVLGDRPIEIRGALDCYEDREIDALNPASDADTLHTRRRDGTDVVVSKTVITSRMGELIEDANDHPTLVACTGRFAGLPDRPNVLYPSVVLAGLVDAVLPSGGRLGVLVPLDVQVAPFQAQWTSPTREAIAVAANPGSDATDASATLSRAAVDLVILDCFGFHEDTLQQVRAGVDRPVLSAVRCTAHLANELLG